MYCINSFGHKTGTVATVELFSYLRSPQVICEAPFQIVISRFQRERLYIETIFASLSSNFNKNQIFFSYLFSLLTDLVRLCHRFSFFSSPPSQILFGSTIVSISFNDAFILILFTVTSFRIYHYSLHTAFLYIYIYANRQTNCIITIIPFNLYSMCLNNILGSTTV